MWIVDAIADSGGRGAEPMTWRRIVRDAANAQYDYADNNIF